VSQEEIEQNDEDFIVFSKISIRIALIIFLFSVGFMISILEILDQ